MCLLIAYIHLTLTKTTDQLWFTHNTSMTMIILVILCKYICHIGREVPNRATQIVLGPDFQLSLGQGHCSAEAGSLTTHINCCE